MQNSIWYFREENKKIMVEKNKQWSVKYRGCAYFMNQMHVTERTFKQFFKNCSLQVSKYQYGKENS